MNCYNVMIYIIFFKKKIDITERNSLIFLKKIEKYLELDGNKSMFR
jgi:hypothetical protein